MIAFAGPAHAAPSVVNNGNGSITVTGVSPNLGPSALYLCDTSIAASSCTLSANWLYTIEFSETYSAGTLVRKNGSFTLDTPLPAGTYNMAIYNGVTQTITAGSELSNVVISTLSTKPEPPNAPTAVAGVGAATVTVTAASTGGTPTSFTVTSSPDAKTCTITLPATSCEVTGLTNGTPYTFTATATNADGTSVASAASATVTPNLLPNGPKNKPVFVKASKIAQPGVTVLLKTGVVTESGATAKAKVTFVEYVQGLRPKGDVVSKKLGTYKVTKSGKVIATVLSSEPMSITLTLRSPATDTYTAYKSTKTWIVK